MAPRQSLRIKDGTQHVLLYNYNLSAQHRLSMQMLHEATRTTIISAEIAPLLHRLGRTTEEGERMPMLEMMTSSGWKDLSQVHRGSEPQPPEQLADDQQSVRLAGGPHRKFTTYNATVAVAVRMTQEKLKNQPLVTDEIAPFLKYLGQEFDVGAPMPAIKVVRRGEWVNINNASNRYDEYSLAQAWFVWTTLLMPLCMNFSAPQFEGMSSIIDRVETWLRARGHWCATPEAWAASDHESARNYAAATWFISNLKQLFASQVGSMATPTCVRDESARNYAAATWFISNLKPLAQKVLVENWEFDGSSRLLIGTQPLFN